MNRPTNGLHIDVRYVHYFCELRPVGDRFLPCIDVTCRPVPTCQSWWWASLMYASWFFIASAAPCWSIGCSSAWPSCRYHGLNRTDFGTNYFMFRCWTSVLLRHVVFWVYTSVSEKHTASIFKVKFSVFLRNVGVEQKDGAKTHSRGRNSLTFVVILCG
jgi:hypothetical protein